MDRTVALEYLDRCHQIVARIQFHQSPTKPIYWGGALIVLGGLIMSFWKA